MNKIKQGDIFLINFDPGVGHEYQKARPAIIISSNEVLSRSNLVTCIALTGNTGQIVEADDIKLIRDAKNRLQCDSIIKMHHLASFDKIKRVKNYIGAIDQTTMSKIKKQLRTHFDI